MTIKTSISISDEIDEKIRNYAKLENINFSKAISILVELGLKNLELSSILEKQNSDINRLFSYLSLAFDLEKQLYSDLQIENITNPSKNLALQEFFKKRKGNILDE